LGEGERKQQKEDQANSSNLSERALIGSVPVGILGVKSSSHVILRSKEGFSTVGFFFLLVSQDGCHKCGCNFTTQNRNKHCSRTLDPCKSCQSENLDK
jgi:hypothetical protein